MCTECDDKVRKTVDEKRPQIDRDPTAIRLRNEMLQEFHNNVLKAGELTVPTVMKLMVEFGHSAVKSHINALLDDAKRQMGMMLPQNFFASAATNLMQKDIITEAATRLEQGQPLLEVPTENLDNVVGFPRAFKQRDVAAMVH